MKLSVGLLAASASLALGWSSSSQASPADVFMFPFPEAAAASKETPQIPRQLARLILLQRLSADSLRGSSISDVPKSESLDVSQTVTYLNWFGARRPRQKSLLVTDDPYARVEPSQLVVLVEGVTADNAQPLRDAAAKLAGTGRPAFTVTEPPASLAHGALRTELLGEGEDWPAKKCSIELAINPFEEECWYGKKSVLRFDLQTDRNALTDLAANLDRIIFFAGQGSLETTVVLLPEASRRSSVSQWSSSSVSRRSSEEVLSAASASSTDSEPQSSPSTEGLPPPPVGIKQLPKLIPACFGSYNRCMETTNSCSGHGFCGNKFVDTDPHACFTCVCQGTVEKGSGSVTHWGGAACQKIDVSAPFWLFVGFTVVIIGTVGAAIGMLFAVGEEKLPGVIGAGVSKAK